MQAQVLDSFLRTGLKVVFCGNEVGEIGAPQQTPYTAPNDKFWNVLEATGLTPEKIAPADVMRLLDFNIGLTEVAKGKHGLKRIRGAEDYDGARLRQRILQYKPRILAFNGKKAAAVYFECKPGDLDYGVHRRKIGTTEMWIMPSTSSPAAWDEKIWHELSAVLRDIPDAPVAEASEAAEVTEPAPAGEAVPTT